MIFQDCGGTLNPIRKIGSQYVEYICTHTDVYKAEAWKKGCSMLQKMRLPDAENIMKSYPHQLYRWYAPASWYRHGYDI